MLTAYFLFSVVVIIESQPFWGTQHIQRTVTDIQITSLNRFPGIIASDNIITNAMGQQLVNINGALYPLMYDQATAQCVAQNAQSPPHNVCPCCHRWSHAPKRIKTLTSIKQFEKNILYLHMFNWKPSEITTIHLIDSSCQFAYMVTWMKNTRTYFFHSWVDVKNVT